jgi:hypothetical protein
MTTKNELLEIFKMDDEEEKSSKKLTGTPLAEYGPYLMHAKEVLVIAHRLSLDAYGKTGVPYKRIRTLIEKLDDVIILYEDENGAHFDPLCPFHDE